MKSSDKVSKINNTDEVSIDDFFKAFRDGAAYLKSKIVIIILFAIVGVLGGLVFSIFKKPTYSAVCTFVLEDGGKSSGLGQYAGLASLAGVDISGAGSSGLFQGDNIIELYKSRLMIEKTLLSQVAFNGKKQLLIDRYIDFNHLRLKWKKDDGIDKITFNTNSDNFNRAQDSIITDITENFNKEYLTILKPDKKLNIIDVGFTSKDELFAKEFTDKLVETVNNFYTQTKTKKSYQNVQILQRQADSVKQTLNSSISGVASAIDAAPNANPLMVSLHVTSQKRQVDVQASTAIYSEVVKNLELAKISLRQEKPLIQIIDSPVLPLLKNRVTKVKGAIIGFFLGIIISVIFLLIRRLFKESPQNTQASLV